MKDKIIIDDIIKTTIYNFNLITPKKKMIFSKKMSFKKLDSLDFLNLSICLEDVLKEKFYKSDLTAQINLNNKIHNYNTLKKFLLNFKL
jgi:hypothetical protein